jgi:hypothetical protein
MAPLFSSCAVLSRSDKAYVADAEAERIYQADRYHRLCQRVQGPPTCEQMGRKVDELLDAERLANRVQKVGRVPSQEKAELEALLKAVRELP